MEGCWTFLATAVLHHRLSARCRRSASAPCWLILCQIRVFGGENDTIVRPPSGRGTRRAPSLNCLEVGDARCTPSYPWRMPGAACRVVGARDSCTSSCKLWHVQGFHPPWRRCPRPGIRVVPQTLGLV